LTIRPPDWLLPKKAKVGLFGILSVAGYMAGKNDRSEQGMDASLDYFPVADEIGTSPARARPRKL
jgi:hypothetical protein